MPKHDLVDVDVSGVHFVGSPANRKRFALVKHLEGSAPEDRMPEKDKQQTFKKTELLEKLGALTGDTVTIDDLAIAMGGRGAIAKEDETIDDGKGGKVTMADLVATIGTLQKSQKATNEALELLVSTQKAAVESGLAARREQLKKAGIPCPDQASADVIDALEKANTATIARLEKAGVLRQMGDSSRQAREAGLREMVTKAVERKLGRTPIGKDEDVRERLRIYRAHPGLLTQVVKEERKRRSA